MAHSDQSQYRLIPINPYTPAPPPGPPPPATQPAQPSALAHPPPPNPTFGHPSFTHQTFGHPSFGHPPFGPTPFGHQPLGHYQPFGQLQTTPTFSHGSSFPLDPQIQMRRMSEEMGDLYRQMQHQVSHSMGGDTWLNEDTRMDNPIVTDENGKRMFKLHFDLHQFKPEEIRVSTRERNLTVSAKHEDNQEGRTMHREYNRSYVLPDNLDLETLTSKFANGILNIEAPLPVVNEKKEHVIAIEHHT